MNAVMAMAVFMVKLVGSGINSNEVGFLWCLRAVEGLRYASQIMMGGFWAMQLFLYPYQRFLVKKLGVSCRTLAQSSIFMILTC